MHVRNVLSGLADTRFQCIAKMYAKLFRLLLWAIPFRWSLLTYLYLRRHSPGAGWAGITNRVDHVSNGSIPGSAVLCELTRHFHPVLSPSCVAEDSRSGNRFQVGLDRGSPCLRHVRGCVGRRRSFISSPSGRLAAWPNQLSILCTSSAGMLVRQRRRRSSTDGTQSLRLTRRMRRMLSLSKTSNILSSATRTGHVSQP